MSSAAVLATWHSVQISRQLHGGRDFRWNSRKEVFRKRESVCALYASVVAVQILLDTKEIINFRLLASPNLRVRVFLNGGV